MPFQHNNGGNLQANGTKLEHCGDKMESRIRAEKVLGFWISMGLYYSHFPKQNIGTLLNRKTGETGNTKHAYRKETEYV